MLRSSVVTNSDSKPANLYRQTKIKRCPHKGVIINYVAVTFVTDYE